VKGFGALVVATPKPSTLDFINNFAMVFCSSDVFLSKWSHSGQESMKQWKKQIIFLPIKKKCVTLHPLRVVDYHLV